MERKIRHRYPVQPGLNVVVEDSGCILLELTTPDGDEVIALSGALSNGGDLKAALDEAREEVAADSNAADYVRRAHVLKRRSAARVPKEDA